MFCYLAVISAFQLNHLVWLFSGRQSNKILANIKGISECSKTNKWTKQKHLLTKHFCGLLNVYIFETFLIIHRVSCLLCLLIFVTVLGRKIVFIILSIQMRRSIRPRKTIIYDFLKIWHIIMQWSESWLLHNLFTIVPGTCYVLNK